MRFPVYFDSRFMKYKNALVIIENIACKSDTHGTCFSVALSPLRDILGYNILYIHSQRIINNRYPDVPLPTTQWVIGNRK